MGGLLNLTVHPLADLSADASENSKAWPKTDKRYSLNSVKEKPNLNIYYDVKIWKPEIHLEFLETENFPLLMCAIFLMWQKQKAEYSSS